MYCKNCGNLLNGDSSICSKCGTIQENTGTNSKSIDFDEIVTKGKNNISLILIGFEIFGFFINLFFGTFGGFIVIASMVAAIVFSMSGYKANRSRKGFKSYVEYIWSGVTGKNPNVPRLECLAVATGVAIYLISVIVYMYLSGQQTEDVYYYETWSLWY